MRATDPLGGVTAFAYDPNGNLLRVTDARGNTTSYAYDGMDRLTSRTDPLLHADRYQYDPNGNLTQVTDRKGQITTIAYDALDRPTQVTFAGGATISTTYDGGGRPTQVVDSVSGTIALAYDDLDRLTAETTAQGSVSYTYDAAGRPTGMPVAGQPPVTYAYDSTDRPTAVTQGAATVSVAYDTANRPTTLTLPNGVALDYSYDRASQLTGITYRLGGTTLGDLTYGYDTAGRRTSVGGTWARTGLPQPVASASYNAANQLTQWGTTALTYDLNGNLTSDGSRTYTWDARDRLTAIGGAATASFAYDAFGRRTSTTVGGTTTGLRYAGPNVVQELSGGTPSANLLTGGVDQVFQRTDAAGTRTLLPDGLGSTLALVDAAGVVQTQYTYDPFGNTTTSGQVSTNPTQYTGREHDGTGLYFYRARYYHPGLQRFISEDPLGVGGGDANLYSYVGNSPTNYTDPSGEVPPVVVWAAVTCLRGAGWGVGFRLAEDLLTGRKVTLGGALRDAALGCLVDLATGGLGKLASHLPGIGDLLDGLLAKFVARYCSFSPDTPVATPDGERPIGALQAGDQVLAYDETTGTTGSHAVTAVLVHEDPVIVHLSIDGEDIETTPEHPFYVAGRGWVAAGDLWAGAPVRRAEGGSGTVQAVAVEPRPATMYNLTVAEAHTFFVGDQQWLVHNSCGFGVTFGQRGHGARHLAGTGLSTSEVEAAITQAVHNSLEGSSKVGSFWGRVSVRGVTIEFRAYNTGRGRVHVGTYYAP